MFESLGPRGVPGCQIRFLSRVILQLIELPDFRIGQALNEFERPALDGALHAERGARQAIQPAARGLAVKRSFPRAGIPRSFIPAGEEGEKAFTLDGSRRRRAPGQFNQGGEDIE